MGEGHTALATVRTTWAHKGVFALNVGVVDPGWKGPVATALVNFSMEEFEVKVGDAFMRLLFTEHTPTNSASPEPVPLDQYVKDIKIKSLNFADSFLNVNSLVEEVAKEIFKLGKVARFFAVLGLAATFLSIFAPIAYSAWMDGTAGKLAIAKLERRVEELEEIDKKREKRDQETQTDLLAKAAKDKQAELAAMYRKKSASTSARHARDINNSSIPIDY